MIKIAAITRRNVPLSRRRLEQALTARGAYTDEKDTFILSPMTGAKIRVRKYGWQWRFSVDTQIHGPGLHLYFYQLLQELAEELKLTYKIEDPALFSRDMDPARLNAFYQQELLDISRELAANPVNSRLQAHWALPGYTLEEGAGVAGPISRWGRSQYLARCRDDMDSLMEEFYVAPHAMGDGVFFRNEALFILQNEITYLRESEVAAAEQVCLDLEQASQLHPTLPLPLEEYLRCARLAGREPLALPNPPLSWGLIGYRREYLRQHLDGFSWVHPGHFDTAPAQDAPWMRMGDRQFVCHWAMIPYSADRDPHYGYPTLNEAPLFKGMPAPELAQDDASQGLKCSRRIGDRQLIVMISFEAPYTWQDVFDLLNSVNEENG